MNIPYRHIIIVPATEETATDPTLMARLVDQMEHYRSMSLTIPQPSPCNNRVTQTSNNLLLAITNSALSTNPLSQSSYNTPENVEALEPRASAKAHFEAVLKAGTLTAEVMVLVVEPRIAPVIPLAILVDVLGNDSIYDSLDLIIEAGGAATVDCVRKSLNVLHP